MSVTAHADMAGCPLRVQGSVVGGGSVYGMGDPSCSNSRIERFTIHWRVGVQCCHYQLYSCGACEFDCGTRNIGIHYNHSADFNIHNGDIVFVVSTENERYLGKG